MRDDDLRNQFTAYMQKVVYHAKVDYIRRKKAQRPIPELRLHEAAEPSYEQDFSLVSEPDFDFEEQRLANHVTSLPLIRRKQQAAAFLGEGYIKNNFVCKHGTGKAFYPNYITERFNRLLKRHGLPHIRFHDLRHSAATMLLASGFSLKEIQEWLGHADIGTTANIYANVLYKSKENIASYIGDKLRVG